MAIFMTLFLAVPFSLSAESVPRIETKWGAYDPEEILFISADNTVIKRMPACTEVFEDHGVKDLLMRTFSEIHVTEDGSHALRLKESRIVHKRTMETVKGKEMVIELCYFNTAGNMLWEKRFTITTFSHPLGKALYDFCISDGGTSVAFFAVRQKQGGTSTDIWVFDRAGKARAHTRYSAFLEKPEISPDGEIIGAYMKDKMLYFWDISTGQRRIVDAKGDGWDGFFILSSPNGLLPDGKIRIGWRPLKPREHETLGRRVLTKDVGFVALPSSMRDFFRGKK